MSMLTCVVHWMILVFFFFFKQKTAYEMRISDWSSDVCSSDLKLTDITIAQGFDIAPRSSRHNGCPHQHGLNERPAERLIYGRHHQHVACRDPSDTRRSPAHEPHMLSQLQHLHLLLQCRLRTIVQRRAEHRSAARRVGKEGVGTCSYLGWW